LAGLAREAKNVRLAALNLEDDLRVDLGGLEPEAVIQRISGFTNS